MGNPIPRPLAPKHQGRGVRMGELKVGGLSSKISLKSESLTS